MKKQKSAWKYQTIGSNYRENITGKQWFTFIWPRVSISPKVKGLILWQGNSLSFCMEAFQQDIRSKMRAPDLGWNQMGWEGSCSSSPSPSILNRSEPLKFSIWLKRVASEYCSFWLRFTATFSATAAVFYSRGTNFLSRYRNAGGQERVGLVSLQIQKWINMSLTHILELDCVYFIQNWAMS